MRKSVCIIFLMIGISLSAQNVAVKTNLLYDATTTFNLGAEIGLSPPGGRWICPPIIILFHFLTTRSGSTGWRSLRRATGSANASTDTLWDFIYWGDNTTWGGVKLPFGIYPSVEDYRYEGYYYGAGLAYGYQWVLGKHWSFEASLGLGYVRAHYDRYDCPRCGEWKGKGDKNYLGVTKAAISLIYVIK